MENIFSLIPKEHRFTFIDVGAMGGLPKKWEVYRKYMKTILFEPDERDAKRYDADISVYLKYLLLESSQEIKFYVTRIKGRSSIYKPNRTLLDQYADSGRFDIIEEIIIPKEKVTTLDDIKEKYSLEGIDFIKLDTQGSELGILRGGERSVLSDVLGIQIEVEFVELYKNQPLFHDVNAYLCLKGFELIDLKRHYWKKKNFCEYHGKGQIIFADAIYFKNIDKALDSISKCCSENYKLSKIAKSVIVYLVYGMYDYADLILVKAYSRGLISKAIFSDLQTFVRKSAKKYNLPNFKGRDFLFKIFDRLSCKLKESYHGWGDCDRYMANVRDK